MAHDAAGDTALPQYRAPSSLQPLQPQPPLRPRVLHDVTWRRQPHDVGDSGGVECDVPERAGGHEDVDDHGEDGAPTPLTPSLVDTDSNRRRW